HVFALGQGRRVAVKRGRRCIHYALHLRVASGNQQVEGPVDVSPISSNGISNRARHRWNRGLVQHVVRAAACLGYGAKIDQIDLTEVDAGAEINQVLRFTRAEVVDAAHRFPAADQFAGNRRSNEARDPSYKIKCHSCSLAFSQTSILSDSAATRGTSLQLVSCHLNPAPGEIPSSHARASWTKVTFSFELLGARNLAELCPGES